ALDQLASAELIFRRGVPPDAEYTFKHVLVQDAAYSTLLRSRRQQLHGRIATTLERQFPELVTAQPPLMAQHSAEAGLNEKAGGLLAQGRSADNWSICDDGSGRSVAKRVGPPDEHARQRCTPTAGTR